jgi:hypothetical protein
MKFMLQNDSKKKGLILRIILFAAIVSLICLFVSVHGGASPCD